jgi:signal transduction histidine kinase
VLLNLATNALRILERGEVELGARVAGGNSVEFWVSDSGPGFAAASLSSLCRPFRDDAMGGKPRFSTAGLSLAICRKLLAAMHSELELETSLEEGSRFFFRLDLPVCDMG